MTTNIKTLQVLLHDHLIGTITHLPGDKNLFAFDSSYVQNSSRPTLSLSFKNISGDLITDAKITQTRLPPFFANLLPEGSLRDYLAKLSKLNPKHEFSLLEALGQDLPGALTVQVVNDEKLFQGDLSKSSIQKKKESPLRFSLAGVQLKFSAIEAFDHGLTIPVNGIGGGWIIKLPHSGFKEVPENEYTMMELARKIGIDVPQTSLVPIDQIQGLPKGFEQLGNNVFAIKRFDRTESRDKVHIEDFAQVFDVYPEKKYKHASYRNIADVIWRETGETGIIEFIKRFVFNALIGNGDMHLKNWSLIYREKNKPSLAPAYDFVSTIPYLPEDSLALTFVNDKSFESLTLEQFKRFAAKTLLPENLILNTVEETLQSFSEVWKTVKDLPLNREIHSAISKHLQTLPLWNRN